METIQNPNNLFKNKGCLIFFAAMVIGIGYLFRNSCNCSQPTSYSNGNDSSIQESANVTIINKDSLEKAKWNNFEESLGGFVLGKYLNGEYTPMNGVGQLQEFAEMVNVALNSNDSTLVERAAKWRSELSSIQRTAFPLLRKAWGKEAGEKLWREDIDVRVFGTGNTKIEFIGGTFAANRNIEVFQNELQLAFKDMRFQRIQYKWYKGADEYTYFTISTKSDSEL
ncbi:MAG: hypothetical protein IPM81_04230 [Saprospirales bacterium]|nr:hypothetical protein [Saprospirales bacterium]